MVLYADRAAEKHIAVLFGVDEMAMNPHSRGSVVTRCFASRNRVTRYRRPPNMTVSAALEVLGLSAGATEQEIRAAHRTLALVWHPDRFVADSETQKLALATMKKINRAFEVLDAASFQAKGSSVDTDCETPQRDTWRQANDSRSKDPHKHRRGNDGRRDVPPQTSDSPSGQSHSERLARLPATHKRGYLSVVAGISSVFFYSFFCLERSRRSPK